MQQPALASLASSGCGWLVEMVWTKTLNIHCLIKVHNLLGKPPFNQWNPPCCETPITTSLLATEFIDEIFSCSILGDV